MWDISFRVPWSIFSRDRGRMAAAVEAVASSVTTAVVVA